MKIFSNILVLTFCIFVCQYGMVAQQYNDYIGAGHHAGVTVSASSQEGMSLASRTVDGTGLNAKLLDISRFLGQATFGADEEDMTYTAKIGISKWIDEQFTIPPQKTLPAMKTIWSQIIKERPDAYGPYALHFNYAWWQINMTNQDLLRQRVAYALSQILVTSINSDLGQWAECISSYYDIFIENAFGNYKDILMSVTRHPAMGYYLSHLNNYPEDSLKNIHPDENFAREIMQLFTIGLYKLNQDGTRVLDSNGKPIPTYNNNDIKQLAKIFTGLGAGAMMPIQYCPTKPEFGTQLYCIEKTTPMKMFGWAHQKGSKTFLGHTVPGSNTYTDDTALSEVEDAVTFLFNHPNTGPFISYRLIQRLVKSNPSPEYVFRVASAFSDNGQGVRGDMKAVIKAILLDKEATSNMAYPDPKAGKLREPFIRYTHLARAMPTASHRNRYWNNGYGFLQATRQHVMAAPSVFNFYTPDHQPVGEFGNAGLVAPEFKLHNTSTSVGYINEVLGWSFWNGLMYSWEGTDTKPDNAWILTNELEAICEDTEKLINHLDKLLTHGQLTDPTRQLLRNSLNPVYWTWDQQWRYWRSRLAVYLFMISPDYNCVK